MTSEAKCYHFSQNFANEVPELYSSQEEADIRLLLHAAHASRNNFNGIIITSDDTDILLLCIAHQSSIGVTLYQKSNTKSRVTYTAIQSLSTALGEDVCKALPNLHAFTGCDTFSALAGKGKMSALKLLKKSEISQKTFQELGVDLHVSQQLFHKLESFTCKMYCAKTSVTK